MLPKHVRYQTALHPVRVSPTQATLIIIPETRLFVNTFFQKNQNYFQSGFKQRFQGYVQGEGSPPGQCSGLCQSRSPMLHRCNASFFPAICAEASYYMKSVTHHQSSHYRLSNVPHVSTKYSVNCCRNTPLLVVENPVENRQNPTKSDRKALLHQLFAVFHILWFVSFFTKQNTKCCVLFY